MYMRSFFQIAVFKSLTSTFVQKKKKNEGLIGYSNLIKVIPPASKKLGKNGFSKLQGNVRECHVRLVKDKVALVGPWITQKMSFQLCWSFDWCLDGLMVVMSRLIEHPFWRLREKKFISPLMQWIFLLFTLALSIQWCWTLDMGERMRVGVLLVAYLPVELTNHWQNHEFVIKSPKDNLKNSY